MVYLLKMVIFHGYVKQPDQMVEGFLFGYVCRFSFTHPTLVIAPTLSRNPQRFLPTYSTPTGSKRNTGRKVLWGNPDTYREGTTTYIIYITKSQILREKLLL